MKTSNHLETLAKTLYGEARAKDSADAEAIAAVIVNRKNLPNWPNDISAVCLQPYQFSCWNVSDPNRTRIMNAKGAWYEQCKIIAERAIVGRLPDATSRSTHYHTPAVKPKWSKGKKPVYKTNGHLFFNNIDTKPPATAREALNQKRPLSSTRGVQGGAMTGVGITLSAAADIVGEVQTQVEPLIAYSDVLKYVFIGVALIGVIITIYARWDDRRKGKI